MEVGACFPTFAAGLLAAGQLGSKPRSASAAINTTLQEIDGARPLPQHVRQRQRDMAGAEPLAATCCTHRVRGAAMRPRSGCQVDEPPPGASLLAGRYVTFAPASAS